MPMARTANDNLNNQMNFMSPAAYQAFSNSNLSPTPQIYQPQFFPGRNRLAVSSSESSECSSSELSRVSELCSTGTTDGQCPTNTYSRATIHSDEQLQSSPGSTANATSSTGSAPTGQSKTSELAGAEVRFRSMPHIFLHLSRARWPQPRAKSGRESR